MLKYLLNSSYSKVSCMNEQMKVEVQGYQILDKKVKGSGKGTSGRVYLPKEWIGRHVKVILLEPVVEEE